MKVYSRRFVNEQGDTVNLSLSEEVRHGLKGIRIYIEGPSSDVESFVSPQEAVELLEGLTKLLKPKRR